MTKFKGDRSVRILIHGSLLVLGLASGAQAVQQPVLTDRDTFSMDLGLEKRPTKHWRNGSNHPKGLIHYWLVAEPVNGGVRISEMASASGFKVLSVHRDLGKMVYKVELNAVDGADSTEARLKAFPEFFSLEPVTNQNKIHRSLATETKDRTARKWARSGNGEKDPLLDTVQVYITHGFSKTADVLLWAKSQGIRNPKVVTETVLQGDVLWGQIELLSAAPQVRSIDRHSKGEPLNDVSRATLGLASLQYGDPKLGFLDTVSAFSSTWNSKATSVGRNVVVGVFDGGVNDTHPDLHVSKTGDRRASLPGETWNLGVFDHDLMHGTHVAGIILGNGSCSLNGGRPYQYRGIAPWAQLYSLAPDFGTHAVDVGNFSWLSMGRAAEYNSDAMSYDDLIANHSLRPVYVFAVGNNGQPNPQSTQTGYFSMLNDLKNGIKVGAVDKAGSKKAPFSSMGPTRDGRLGPDVMAPGAGVIVDGTMSVRSIAVKRGTTLRNFWDPKSNAATFNPLGTARNYVNDGISRTFSGAQGIGYMATLPAASTWTMADGDTLYVTMSGPLEYLYKLELQFSDGTTEEGTIMQSGVVNVPIAVPPGFFWTNLIGKTITGIGVKADFVQTAVVSSYARWTSWFWDANHEISYAWAYGSTALSGTSMAAPMVTGTVALMHEKFALLPGRSHTNHMWNSTVKAILVHTAKDLVNLTPNPGFYNNPDFLANATDKTANLSDVYGVGPDWATGYGLVDASKAVAITATTKVLEDTADQNLSKVYRVVIPAGQKSFRATLAWDDPGSSGNTKVWQKALVNDLDLSMTSPTGAVFRPWVLDPGIINDSLDTAQHKTGIDPKVTLQAIQNNPAHPGVDSLNNLEVVDIVNPAAGVWTITVTPRLLGRSQHPATQPGLHQDFSLVTDIATSSKASGPMIPTGSNGFKFNNPNSTSAVILADGSIWMKDCTGTVPVTGGFAWWFGGIEKASLYPTSGLRSTTYTSAQSAWLSVAANKVGGWIVSNPSGTAMARIGQDASIRVAGVSNCNATGF